MHPAFSGAGGGTCTAALDLCPSDARADLVALATTVPGAPALQEALDRLEFDAASRGIVVKAADGAHFLCGFLEQPDLSDADLWRALRRKTPEAVAVAGAMGAGAAAAERWLPTCATGGWRSPATTSWRRA